MIAAAAKGARTMFSCVWKLERSLARTASRAGLAEPYDLCVINAAEENHVMRFIDADDSLTSLVGEVPPPALMDCPYLEVAAVLDAWREREERI